jgi:hypothetical protein
MACSSSPFRCFPDSKLRFLTWATWNRQTTHPFKRSFCLWWRLDVPARAGLVEHKERQIKSGGFNIGYQRHGPIIHGFREVVVQCGNRIELEAEGCSFTKQRRTR